MTTLRKLPVTRPKMKHMPSRKRGGDTEGLYKMGSFVPQVER